MNLGLATLTVSAGEHIGHFYRSKEEAKHLYISFVKEGLWNGDTCMCRLPYDFPEEEFLEALQSFQIDAGEALHLGRLIFDHEAIRPEEFQLKMEFLTGQLPANGLLRWVSDITRCVHGSNSSATDQFSCLANLPVVALYQYDLSKLSGTSLIDAQMRHPVWIINDVVHNNPLSNIPQWFDQRYRILIEINQLASTLDRASFLTGIGQVVRKSIPFDRFELALYESKERVFRIVGIQEDSVVIETEFSSKDSLLLKIIEANEPALYNDLKVEAEDCDPFVQKLRSAVIVPIQRNESVIGTLNVGSMQSHQYSRKDMELFTEVARQIALPLENILAHEEIARLRTRLDYEYLYLKEEIHVQRQFKSIIGQSLVIRRVLKAVETVAPTDAGVLLYGETGTGKELVVDSIHELNQRKEMPLVKINCAALPAGLMESELFGHEKGSFTGAFTKKLGSFEMANGGTIFLDEIGDLQLDLQSKLLRVLQEGEFERVGGHQTIRTDVRVIAATNRDLEKSIYEGKFRADLYYRLNVFPIRIPPLRERKEDIPLLVKYFVMKYGARFRKNIEHIPQVTIDALLAYSWPGNIRELENLIERAVILCQNTELEPGKWLPQPGGSPVESRISTLEELEKEHILEVLQMTTWRVSGEKGAAKLLGIKPTTLEARMRKLGIQRQQF